MKQGGKGRKRAADKLKLAKGDLFASGVARFAAEVKPAENDAGAMVCLVSVERGDGGDALVQALSTSMRIREAASLQGGGKTLFLFPATGLAVVLLGALAGASSATGAGRAEHELAQLLSRRGAMAASAAHVLDNAGRFANVVALVVDDVDLCKYLSVHTSAANNVAIVACHGVAGAEQQVLKLAQTQTLWKSATRQQMQSDFMAKCVCTTVSSPAVLELVWNALGIERAAERQLVGSDLLDLLAGRASVAVCQEVRYSVVCVFWGISLSRANAGGAALWIYHSHNEERPGHAASRLRHRNVAIHLLVVAVAWMVTALSEHKLLANIIPLEGLECGRTHNHKRHVQFPVESQHVGRIGRKGFVIVKQATHLAPHCVLLPSPLTKDDEPQHPADRQPVLQGQRLRFAKEAALTIL
jgi:hypothetical protein